jgi:hypothetical protein
LRGERGINQFADRPNMIRDLLRDRWRAAQTFVNAAQIVMRGTDLSQAEDSEPWLQGDLIQLAPKVRARGHVAIGNVSIDGRRRSHPRLGNTEHEIAVAWVVRQFGPTQTVQREHAHFVWSDHDPA